MAYDKVVDSSVLDAGLKQIADAIREKGGTSDNLEFPNAMTEAIAAIQSGSSSNDSTLEEIINRSIKEVNNNATTIGRYVFINCYFLKTANFPSATSIGDSAFQSCSMLTTVDFPLVTNVGSCAFQHCDVLTTVDFPSLTYIGYGAFQYCYKLIALILREEEMCTLGSPNVFDYCYHIVGTVNTTYNPDGLKDGYIYVPSALMETYQSGANWSKYSTQFRALEDYTVDGTISGALDLNKI
jgi:hypothetical protein